MLEGTLKFLTGCDTFSEKLSTRVQGTYLTTFTQISYILRVAHLCTFSCKMLLATWVNYSLIIALFAGFFLDKKKKIAWLYKKVKVQMLSCKKLP